MPDGQVRGEGRADDVAGQIGGAKIAGLAGVEPPGLDQRRYEGRIAEAAQTDSDQERRQPGERRTPETRPHGM